MFPSRVVFTPSLTALSVNWEYAAGTPSSTVPAGMVSFGAFYSFWLEKSVKAQRMQPKTIVFFFIAILPINLRNIVIKERVYVVDLVQCACSTVADYRILIPLK